MIAKITEKLGEIFALVVTLLCFVIGVAFLFWILRLVFHVLF